MAIRVFTSASYSHDGTKVVYVSDLDFAVPGTDHNGRPDIYVVGLDDLGQDPDTRVLISMSSTGGQHFGFDVGAPSFSPDDLRVVFEATTSSFNANDTNGVTDIYIKNLQTGAVTRVSLTNTGAQAFLELANNPSFSPDGKKVIFDADEGSIIDYRQVYIKGLVTGQLQSVSRAAPLTPGDPFAGPEGNLGSERGSFSPDGNKVVFESLADNLVPNHGDYGPRDIFVKDLITGAVTLISHDTTGDLANGNSSRAHFSGDGNKIVFVSDASDLVASDTNGHTDVFIKDLEHNTMTRVSVAANGTPGNDDSWDAAISPDGTKVVFTTDATNFGGGADTNQASDIFLKDLVTGSLTRLTTFANDPGESSRLPRFSPDGGVIIWQTAIKRVGENEYDESYFTHVLPSVINGTSGNDIKNGTPRPDRINGLAGNDQLNGLGGNDTLDGGIGNDTMKGGAGDDIYVVNSAADKVIEAANAGTDLVQSSISHTLGANAENLTLIGTAIINGAGNALANTITGNSKANILNGAAGIDSLRGGLGNDSYLVDNASDAVVEVAGAGTDAVKSSKTYTLGVNVENLTLTGATASNGIGNTLANRLNGNAAANTLDGKTGADTMAGGRGNDIYVVDNAGDAVVEKTGEGTDTVKSSVTHTLELGVENLTLTGAGAINGTGNGLANAIVGTAAANNLNGLTGIDTLNGGAGADKFFFTTVLNAASNIDTILAFSVAADTIVLENAVFKGLVAVNADAFVKGAAAADAEDRIIYNSATGALLFDADGTGSFASAIGFARINAGLAVTFADFQVV